MKLQVFGISRDHNSSQAVFVHCDSEEPPVSRLFYSPLYREFFTAFVSSNDVDGRLDYDVENLLKYMMGRIDLVELNALQPVEHDPLDGAIVFNMGLSRRYQFTINEVGELEVEKSRIVRHYARDLGDKIDDVQFVKENPELGVLAITNADGVGFNVMSGILGDIYEYLFDK